MTLVFLLILFSAWHYEHTHADLLPDQSERLFIANEVYNALPGIMGKAWGLFKEAETKGTLKTEEFEKNTFWNDIILKDLKPVHEELKLIDQVVEDHYPSKFLNQIVNLLDLQKLQAASDHIKNTPKVTLVDFWKEAWVRLSSIVEQLHYQYDWIIGHAFEEKFPENLEHSADDDFYMLMNEKTKFYFTWFKTNKSGKASDAEKYAHSMDDVAGSLKVVLQNGKQDDKEFPNNLFVGLRVLLNMHPEIVGPYKDVDSYGNQAQCLGNQEYVGIHGLDYEIPIYVLLYILSAEMKYYVMRNIGEMQHCIRDNCNLKMGPALDKHLKFFYEFYYNEMIKAFKVEDDPITRAPPEAWTWRCDPPETESEKPGKRNFVEGVNYARFYDFDTSFMAEERNLSLTQTCRDSCDMFDGAFSSVPCESDEWQCLESDDDFDCWEKQRQGLECPGSQRTICPNSGLSCTTTRIKNAKVCKGETEDRYIEFIQSDGKMYKQLGEKTTCQTKLEKVRSHQISERSGITKYEPQQCEVCLCKCYEPLGQKSHRYISVVPQMSDISNNRVVVGVRFVKIDDQIHIQIADAATTSQGLVDNSTVQWVENPPVDNTNFSQVFRLGRESKNILLDEVVAPQGYAITGVRLKPIHIPVDRYFETELVLQIHVTAMHETGELDPTDAGWVFNFNDSRFRNEIDIENSEHPINAIGASQPISKTNQYLRVQGSSLKKDAGQTPVPFFDTQEMIMTGENMTHLRGIGLYFKTTHGFGGFLGFRLISEVQLDLPADPRFNLWYFVLLEDRKKKQDSIKIRPLPPIPPFAPRPRFKPSTIEQEENHQQQQQQELPSSEATTVDPQSES